MSDTHIPTPERAAFEAWADDQGFPLKRTVRGDDYQDLRTQGPWEAWQARASAPPTAEPAAEANRALEIALLRDVYEAARRILRYDGIDRPRVITAMEDMDFHIERVKSFDGGTFDESYPAPSVGASSPAPTGAALLLFEHEDGRYGVASEGQADFTNGDPKWHRVGPVDVVRLGAPTVEPAGWIAWQGTKDEHPDDGPIRVSLRFRDGDEHDNCNPFDYTWRDRGLGDDIVAYKIAAPGAPTPAEPQPAEAELTRALTERDAFHEWADKLADAIAEVAKVDIGEHSNLNNPWAEALEAVAGLGAAAVPTRRMVDRFLGWELPKTFWPDCFVTFDREAAKANHGWPRGTNIFTADEARAMLEHVLAGAPQPADVVGVLRAALHDLRYAVNARPSCQMGVMDRCRCLKCAMLRSYDVLVSAEESARRVLAGAPVVAQAAEAPSSLTDEQFERAWRVILDQTQAGSLTEWRHYTNDYGGWWWFLNSVLRAALASPSPDAAREVPEGEHHGLDTAERVCFYEQDFYVLSNFSSFTLEWEDRRFDTSEAAYHWEKFVGNPALMSEIQYAPSAHEAFKIAERNKALRRPDWDDVKVGIMRRILRAKADQHEYVRRKLLATGGRELVENSWRDDYWGWGPNRDGKNMLGKLWMEVRAELRAAARQQAKGGE